MIDGQLGSILRRLRRLAGSAEVGDAPLLERFLSRNDEEAFAALVRRHGPLVLGVCRRVLQHAQDAEDAFQAVFLVLARKAASIRNRDSIGSWLYEVAYRIALKAQASATRRRARERQAAAMQRPQLSSDDVPQLGPVLDEELQRLPEKYRRPLVLCYLQGKTHAQAARELGCPSGSLSRHLARGLELLRERLAQRGLALTGGALVEAMAAQSAAATVTPALAASTARAALAFASGKAVAGLVTAPAATLARGALKTMSITRILAIGIMLVATTAGAGAFAYRTFIESTQPPPDDPPLVADRPEPPAPTRRDRYGDPLPEGALVRLGSIHLRHDGPITAISLSPGGQTMASVSHDGTIRLWDVATGRKLHQWHAHDHEAFGVAYLPDGKHVVSGGGDKLLRLWDAATGQEIRRFVGHRDGVRCLVLSADGRILASGCGGESFGSDESVIRLWDVATGKELRQCAGHVSGVRALAFAPDGKTLASAGGYWENDLRGQTKPDSKLRLWDVASGAQIHALGDHVDGVRSVAFAPDGKTVVSGDRRCLRAWDVATGDEVQRLVTSRDQVPQGLAFDRDGKTLFAGGSDGTLHEWDVATGKERRSFGAGQVNISTLALTPDGKTLAVGGWEKRVRLWSVATGREKPEIQEHHDSVCAVAFAPDGKGVVTASQDATLRLWDAATGTEIRQLVGHKHHVCTVAFSPDGKHLVSGAYMDETFRIWDVATGRQVHELPVHFKALAVAFSPDGKTVALGGESSEVVLCDVATGKPVRRLNKGNGNWVRSLAFSSDGRFLACGDGGPIHLWDLANATLFPRSPLGNHKATQVAFSPDGWMLAATGDDSVIHLGELATGQERLACSGHERPILSLAFSPRGDRLVTGSYDQTVRLWDTVTGKELQRLKGHTATVSGVAFAPDDKRVASASRDNTALVWDASARALPAPAGDRLPEDQLWSDLADADAAKAYRAMASLAAHPAQAVPLLKARLRPAPPPAPERVARLIADLDHDEFAVRDRAFRELQGLEQAIEPALHKALEDHPSLETSRQLERLLGRLKGLTPGRLRGLRSIEVLEHVATTEARQVLDALADKHSDGPLAREARAATARLAGR